MRTTAQIRQWFAFASLRQRWVTSVTAAVAAVLVGLALVPAPGLPQAHREDPVAFGHGTQRGDARSTGSGTAPAPVGTTGTRLGENQATVSGIAPSPGSAGGPSGTTSPRRSAEESGITATSIKVGFTKVDAKSAVALNYSPALRTDIDDVIAALVDDANVRGGVQGRRIEYVTVNPDFVQAADQDRKCVELTETRKVFAVIDSFAFTADTSAACIARQHNTLLLNGVPGAAADQRGDYPNHVSVAKDYNRAVKDLAYGAKAAGFFDPASGFKRLGIYTEENARKTLIEAPDGLSRYLHEVGISDWTEFAIPATLAFHTGARDAVNKFRDAGVTHVMMAVHPPFAKDFFEQASLARYFPKTVLGDYFNLVLGGLAAQYQPETADGAYGITQMHVGELSAKKPEPAMVTRCNEIFRAHGVAPATRAEPLDYADDLEALQLCENFLLFLDVATRAGPDLSRLAWLQSLPGVGEFRPATADLARFGPGKITGGDTMKLVRWHASCKCWRDATDFVPAAG